MWPKVRMRFADPSSRETELCLTSLAVVLVGGPNSGTCRRLIYHEWFLFNRDASNFCLVDKITTKV